MDGGAVAGAAFVSHAGVLPLAAPEPIMDRRAHGDTRFQRSRAAVLGRRLAAPGAAHVCDRPARARRSGHGVSRGALSLPGTPGGTRSAAPEVRVDPLQELSV